MARPLLARELMISAALRSGAVATAGSTLTLLALGKRHARTPWAPIDAVSHIAWGDRAYARDGLDVKHTLVGAALNAAAVTSWAVVQELLLRNRRPSIPTALLAGAATSALAYVVDFHIVPERLTPGFQWKLPKRGLRTTYLALALSLAAGALIARGVRTR